MAVDEKAHSAPTRTWRGSKALDRYAHENGVTLDFNWRGKPTDSAFMESFNGRLRDECLKTNSFL